jgi:hypothetical protein
MSKNVDGGAVESLDEAYERPSLTPIGNLHDLLLGASGVECDAITSQPDNLTMTSGDCI